MASRLSVLWSGWVWAFKHRDCQIGGSGGGMEEGQTIDLTGGCLMGVASHQPRASSVSYR